MQQSGCVHIQSTLQCYLIAFKIGRCILEWGVFEFKPPAFLGRLFADPLEVSRAAGQDCPFCEDWCRVRRGDDKAAVDQMSSELGLRVLVCILSVEVGSSDKGAFLFPMSIPRSSR